MSAHSVEANTNQNSISVLNVETGYQGISAENSDSQACQDSTPPSLPIGMILLTSVSICLTSLAKFVNSTVMPWLFYIVWLFVSASLAALSLFVALEFLFFVYTFDMTPQLSDVIPPLLLLIFSKWAELHAESIYPLQSSECDDCYFTQHDQKVN